MLGPLCLIHLFESLDLSYFILKKKKERKLQVEKHSENASIHLLTSTSYRLLEACELSLLLISSSISSSVTVTCDECGLQVAF